MNLVNITPNVSAYSNMNTISNRNTTFTGLAKKPTMNQAKAGKKVLQRMYQFFFVPSKESVTGLRDGFVYTEHLSKEGTKRTSKKYELFSRKPSEIIEEYKISRITKREIRHKDGSFDREFIDCHTPGYKVSAKYDNLKNKKINEYSDYTGDITLTYGDKKVKLSNNERLDLKAKFDNEIDIEYADAADKLLKRELPYEEFCNKYYKDPNVIASAILKSPSKLEAQLKTVSASMPYGIEAILNKIGK